MLRGEGKSGGIHLQLAELSSPAIVARCPADEDHQDDSAVLSRYETRVGLRNAGLSRVVVRWLFC
jgi:hypothetical protein